MRLRGYTMSRGGSWRENGLGTAKAARYGPKGERMTPKAPPKASEPVSPMNTAAGGALYHKNPSPPPIIPMVKISNSPVPGT